MAKYFKLLITAVACLVMVNTCLKAQGTWDSLKNQAPDYNSGVMVLLTDGTVMCLTSDSSGRQGAFGNTWDLLTPDITGSYKNGTWTRLPSMHDTRLYCSTWVMPDGNLYVGGGEYGTGYATAELFNTATQTWKYIKGVPPNNWGLYDGSAENLYDGTILQAASAPADSYADGFYTLIYKESTNLFSSGPLLINQHSEVSWVKLPDSSIMNVDPFAKTSERYIPKLRKWIVDSNLKNYIMDFNIGETGPGFLLPNGKLLFLSDTTYAAIYTPSGNTSKGSWVQGPAMPVNGGVHLGCPDAPAAMMPDGKILCAFSPKHTYTGPTYFYEYDYRTNTFAQINTPFGGAIIPNLPSYVSLMLNLPDGTILYSEAGSKQYYQYVPSGAPLASGKPGIDNIISNCPGFKITGKLFNGISEGSAYGDDWQMATNYPIVYLTDGSNVYYARTTNWNRVGAVMTDSLEDTANFVIPVLMPPGTYSVVVVANGIASSPDTLTVNCINLGIPQPEAENNFVTVYPNPSGGMFNVIVNSKLLMVNEMQVYNIMGQEISQFTINHSQFTIDLNNQPNGVYLYRVINGDGNLAGQGKLVIQK